MEPYILQAEELNELVVKIPGWEIKSKQLKIKNKIAANRIIFSIIEYELKKYIHSVQILIN